MPHAVPTRRSSDLWRPAAARWRPISAASATATSGARSGRWTICSGSAPMTPDDLQAVAGTRLHDCIAGHARHDSRAEAATAPGRCLSYGELVAEVDACAMAMIAAGVGPGDRVATLAAPGLEFLVSFLASASVGAIWVGLNPDRKSTRLNSSH